MAAEEASRAEWEAVRVAMASRDDLLGRVVEQWGEAHGSVVDAAEEGARVDIPDANAAAREARELLAAADEAHRRAAEADKEEDESEEDLKARLLAEARDSVRHALRLDHLRAQARELAVKEAVGELEAHGGIHGVHRVNEGVRGGGSRRAGATGNNGGDSGNNGGRKGRRASQQELLLLAPPVAVPPLTGGEGSAMTPAARAQAARRRAAEHEAPRITGALWTRKPLVRAGEGGDRRMQ